MSAISARPSAEPDGKRGARQGIALRHVNFRIEGVEMDGETHALVRNMQWASRSSQTPGLQKNSDGSADVYFGPKAPAGKESNWVPTDANRKFEVLFRFYGPQKPLFDKTWKLSDIEKSN